MLRADTPDGTFVTVAKINIYSGDTHADAEVVNIWTHLHSYVPDGGGIDGHDTSPVFHYVEVSEADERCFKVVAYNGAGRGHSSSVQCSGPL